MKNAVILHGTGADSHSNWFQWLKNELQKLGYETWVPDLPNSMYPNSKVNADFIINNWDFNNESIIVGHSSGAVLALYILQYLPDEIKVGSVFAVSAFLNDLGWPNLKNVFVEPFDWEKIRKSAENIVLVHSDNDPYIGLDQPRKIAQNLNANLIIKPNQGHFNLEVGAKFSEFPTLLKIINRTVQD